MEKFSYQPVTVQQYGINAVAGAESKTLIAFNGQRRYLQIQNNGGNPLHVRFGSPAQGNSNDFVIAAGAMMEWRTVPIDSVNALSPLGTTGVLIEGVEPHG